MATTQNGRTKKGSGGVLTPLNIGKSAGVPRTRRTPEQAAQARIDKQLRMAETAAKRAKALADKQKRANERAEKARQLAEQIRLDNERKEREKAEQAQRDADERARLEADSKVGGNSATAGESPTSFVVSPEMTATLKKLSADFDKFYRHVEDTYGIRFTGPKPQLVKRGFISVKAKGELAPQKQSIEYTSSNGVAREAVRFMQHYKLVGLTPAWLNKEVRIKDDPNTYILSGLRGKAHAIVLRKKDSDEAFTMSADDFKKMLAT